MKKLDENSFARGVDEAPTLRPLRVALWSIVRWAGGHTAALGNWLYWAGKAGQRRNRRKGG